MFKDVLDEVTLYKAVHDYKGQLQKLLKTMNGVNPQYRLVEETGPDHDKIFTIQVMVMGESKGTGVGRTKKEAEQAAARSAYEILTEAAGEQNKGCSPS